MAGGTIDFIASLGEWGLFTAEEPRPDAPLKLGDLPPNVRQDLVTVHVEGLQGPAQFFRVTLTPVVEGDPVQYVVVSAYPPFPSEAISDTGRRLLPACTPASLCLIVEDQLGWARATSIADAPPQETAAAVAHVKIVAGWDEADPIVVTVDGEAFQVSGTFRDQRWELAVARAW